MRSTLLETPVRKSACVVSVKHAEVGAIVSAKSWVVVPPSVTTMGVAAALSYPAALAMIEGYVPAGMPVNE